MPRTVPVPTGPTYSTPNPEADLQMNMTGLWAIGKETIPDYVEQLADALDKIVVALDTVQLNWAGKSQREAQDINDRWQACAVALFGSRENPRRGVLGRIAGGIQGAALNYSLVEERIAQAWQLYTRLLDDLVHNRPPTGSGGGGQQSLPISEV